MSSLNIWINCTILTRVTPAALMLISWDKDCQRIFEHKPLDARGSHRLTFILYQIQALPTEIRLCKKMQSIPLRPEEYLEIFSEQKLIKIIKKNILYSLEKDTMGKLKLRKGKRNRRRNRRNIWKDSYVAPNKI